MASRTDFDLKAHQTTSGKDMTYYDQEKNEHYIPYVIEPSLGADRVTLAFLVDAYDEEVVGQDKKGNDDVRTVLRLHPALAPFKAAVLPLSKKLSPAAEKLYHELQRTSWWTLTMPGASASATAGRTRSARPTASPWTSRPWGTRPPPRNNCVTIRERDSMEQVRVPISEVRAWLGERVRF